MANLEWPSDLGRGTLEGRLLWMQGDTSDADRDPDLYPITDGKVTVQASVPEVRYTGDQGSALAVKRLTTGVLDSEGYVCTPPAAGGTPVRGIVVPATDSPLLKPTDFTYKVTIEAGTYRTSFNIKVPTGSTIDLVKAIPVAASGGTAIVVDDSIAIRAESAATRAEAVLGEIETAVNEYVSSNPDIQGAPGLDAYQIAQIEQDFQGSRLDWLESLNGEDSTVPGPPGAPGAVPTSSDYLVVGPGRPDAPTTTEMSPEELDALPIGCEYRSTDGANVGAWGWRKRPSGWGVFDGNTGFVFVECVKKGDSDPNVDAMVAYFALTDSALHFTFRFRTIGPIGWQLWAPNSDFLSGHLVAGSSGTISRADTFGFDLPNWGVRPETAPQKLILSTNGKITEPGLYGGTGTFAPPAVWPTSL